MATLGVNKYPGICFRCGGRVPAGEGVFQYGSGSTPWPWPEFRFQQGIPLVEHVNCNVIYNNTGIHYQLNPDTSKEGFDGDLGLQTDIDP